MVSRDVPTAARRSTRVAQMMCFVIAIDARERRRVAFVADGVFGSSRRAGIYRAPDMT